MKFHKDATCSAIAFSLALVTQLSIAQNKDYAQSFVIDKQKPYVYLKVDHVGSREPLIKGESAQGIWLHLFNNCKIPIVVVEVETPDKRSIGSIILEDEVVLDPRFPVGDTAQFSAAHHVGTPDITDILLFPNFNEAATYSAEVERHGLDNRIAQLIAARPHGYNGGNPPGNRKLRVISPGEEIYFSIPIDHVSSLWHFDIPFRLALEHDVFTKPPYSYVAFYSWDLSNFYQSVPAPIPSTSIPSAINVNHEFSHMNSPSTGGLSIVLP